MQNCSNSNAVIPPPLLREGYKKKRASGFRFNPYDWDLIVHYLDRQIKKQPLPIYGFIHSFDVYSKSPQELSEIFPPIDDTTVKKEWMFFSPRDKKYPNGKRPRRDIIGGKNGLWKATGTVLDIKHPSNANHVLGTKRALKFYLTDEKDPSIWLMDEYMIKNHPTVDSDSKSDKKLNKWVLCKIHMTPEALKNLQAVNVVPAANNIQEQKLNNENNNLGQQYESENHAGAGTSYQAPNDTDTDTLWFDDVFPPQGNYINAPVSSHVQIPFFPQNVMDISNLNFQMQGNHNYAPPQPIRADDGYNSNFQHPHNYIDMEYFQGRPQEVMSDQFDNGYNGSLPQCMDVESYLHDQGLQRGLNEDQFDIATVPSSVLDDLPEFLNDFPEFPYLSFEQEKNIMGNKNKETEDQ